MNANQIADTLMYGSHSMANISEAAALLRRQHEAIVKLREALSEIADNATDPYTDGWAGTIAKNALKDTEGL